MTGFDVLPTELRSHASKLDGLAERLGQALHAARHMSMDGACGGEAPEELVCQA
ncbi:hypothetical protein [Lentzea nigeriaca]|uniref:hypothetical protein n=1 Tax=Lentzea nigeriaca TaxID=1128665 RepID=UPI00195EDC3E|nr:hypothetical protein [Lentzea nigeriaca]MBM7863316.1 hypothetical protein [Lentzea nigeriaca]